MWCLKRFYEGLEGLHKTFSGTTKKCENNVDFYFIQLSEIQFIFSPSFGTGRVKYKHKNIPDFFNPFFATRIFLHPPENNKKPEVSFSFLKETSRMKWLKLIPKHIVEVTSS